MSVEDASFLACIAFLCGVIAGMLLLNWLERRHKQDRERYRR